MEGLEVRFGGGERPGAGVGSAGASPEGTLDHDPILESFLSRQLEEGLALAASSEVVGVLPLAAGAGSPCRFLVRFESKCLVRDPQTLEVREHAGFEAGICFPPDYLRSACNPFQVVTWLTPVTAWHPAIRWPFICVGRIGHAGLVQLIYQIHEIATGQLLNASAADSLNPDAFHWARAHPHRFTVDRRPLRRRLLDLEFDVRPAAAPSSGRSSSHG